MADDLFSSFAAVRMLDAIGTALGRIAHAKDENKTRVLMNALHEAGYAVTPIPHFAQQEALAKQLTQENLSYQNPSSENPNV